MIKAIEIPRSLGMCSNAEQLVYLGLAYIGGKAESVAELCDICDLTRVTINEAIARLVERRMITAEKKPTRHGSQWKIAITGV